MSYHLSLIQFLSIKKYKNSELDNLLSSIYLNSNLWLLFSIACVGFDRASNLRYYHFYFFRYQLE